LGQHLPDLSVELFNPNYDHDKFENTALTIDGRLAGLKLLYTGGYLDRDVQQEQDYTNYARSTYAGYYQCNYPGYPFKGGTPTAGSTGFCFSPSSYWINQEYITHQSHELRLTTPDDLRIRALVGAYWEKYLSHNQDDWYYTTSPNFSPVGPPEIDPYTNPPTYYPVHSNNPNVRPTGDTFVNDDTRGYKQLAVFTSIDFDLIPKVLTLTGGTRWYDISDFMTGSQFGSFGCEIGGPYNGGSPPVPCVSTVATGVLSNINNLDAQHLEKSYVGTRSRVDLKWHVTPDAMLYYTWSQGFRPGGFNRSSTVLRPTSPLYGIWTPPIAYGPDTLINSEVGLKSEWLGHRLLFNVSVYQENWDGVQLLIFDPSVLGNQTFDTNGPNYRVRGVETQSTWRVLDGLTLSASAAWNSSENVKNLELLTKSGQPISDLANPFGALGQPLASSPPFAGNVRARYEFPFGQYNWFLQVAAMHQAHSYSTTNLLTLDLQGNSTRYDDPAFTTYDASGGLSKDSWTAQIYAENFTDTRAILESNYNDYLKQNFINRPRTIGLRISYKFGK
jgi:iron complex outermembrane recepter protein